MHEETLARLKHAPHLEADVRRAIDDGNGGGCHGIDAGGTPHRLRGPAHHLLGEATDTGHADDRIAGSETLHPGPGLQDRAGHFHARREGVLGLHLVLALNDEGIGEVDPTAFDTDDDFTGTGLRVGHIAHDEVFRSPPRAAQQGFQRRISRFGIIKVLALLCHANGRSAPAAQERA